MRYNSDKYEINQAKKKLLESDSEGSLNEFIDDSGEESLGSSSSGSGSGSESDEVMSIHSDEPLKKLSKKSKKKGEPLVRRTRANAGECKFWMHRNPANN